MLAAVLVVAPEAFAWGRGVFGGGFGGEGFGGGGFNQMYIYPSRGRVRSNRRSIRAGCSEVCGDETQPELLAYSCRSFSICDWIFPLFHSPDGWEIADLSV
jgi:hypothetical protein